MSSPFQRYWAKLKTERPDVYQQKLKSNRQRIKNLRQTIYSDPVKHEQYKANQRAAYAAKKAKKLAM